MCAPRIVSTQLLGGERARARAAGRRAVVVGERAQLAAEVGDVGREAGRRAAAAASNSDASPITEPVTRRIPCAASCATSCDGGRPVALLPDLVEGAVAERRVAAAAQVQVAVPDAARGRGGRCRAPWCAAGRSGPSSRQQRDRRVELLDRGRRALDVVAQREQLLCRRSGRRRPRRCSGPPARSDGRAASAAAAPARPGDGEAAASAGGGRVAVVPLVRDRGRASRPRLCARREQPPPQPSRARAPPGPRRRSARLRPTPGPPPCAARRTRPTARRRLGGDLGNLART